MVDANIPESVISKKLNQSCFLGQIMIRIEAKRPFFNCLIRIRNRENFVISQCQGRFKNVSNSPKHWRQSCQIGASRAIHQDIILVVGPGEHLIWQQQILRKAKRPNYFRQTVRKPTQWIMAKISLIQKLYKLTRFGFR